MPPRALHALLVRIVVVSLPLSGSNNSFSFPSPPPPSPLLPPRNLRRGRCQRFLSALYAPMSSPYYFFTPLPLLASLRFRLFFELGNRGNFKRNEGIYSSVINFIATADFDHPPLLFRRTLSLWGWRIIRLCS